MKDIDKELDEIIYEVYRQSRLKEQDLVHKPYDQVKTQALQAIKQLIDEARIDELKKLNHFKDNPEHAPTYGYFEWDYESRLNDITAQFNSKGEE